VNAQWINLELFNKINKIKEIRKSVTAALEIARKDKILGSSLQACVIIYDPENIIPISCDDFWKEVAITSEFKIKKAVIPQDAFVSDDLKNIGVVIGLAEGQKCERCWKITTNLKDQICERCQKVLTQRN
jgi:isoleucyl-tRNA synthetase